MKLAIVNFIPTKSCYDDDICFKLDKGLMWSIPLGTLDFPTSD